MDVKRKLESCKIRLSKFQNNIRAFIFILWVFLACIFDILVSELLKYIFWCFAKEKLQLSISHFKWKSLRKVCQLYEICKISNYPPKTLHNLKISFFKILQKISLNNISYAFHNSTLNLKLGLLKYGPFAEKLLPNYIEKLATKNLLPKPVIRIFNLVYSFLYKSVFVEV